MKKSAFRLFSPVIKSGKMIPAKYTADGANVSPPLHWEFPPQGTKSFALICDDPDAPRGNWVHWLVKNIPAHVTRIEEGEKLGVEVENDFGQLHYGGPAPPRGTHRYLFKLFAMKTASMSAESIRDFYEETEREKLALAVLMGVYKRSDARI